MSELKDKFNEIVKDLEENIENKKDLEYIKTAIYNIAGLFVDEIDKLADLNIDKMNAIIERYKVLSDRVNQVEANMDKLEKELYVEEWSDFEIVCPYCNHEFIIDLNTKEKSEVKCPECNNIIELDWNEEEHNCQGHCDHCGSGCEHDEDDDDDM